MAEESLFKKDIGDKKDAVWDYRDSEDLFTGSTRWTLEEETNTEVAYVLECELADAIWKKFDTQRTTRKALAPVKHAWNDILNLNVTAHDVVVKKKQALSEFLSQCAEGYSPGICTLLTSKGFKPTQRRRIMQTYEKISYDMVSELHILWIENDNDLYNQFSEELVDLVACMKLEG